MKSAHKDTGTNNEKAPKLRGIKPPFDLTWPVALAVIALLAAVCYLLVDQNNMSREFASLQQKNDDRLAALQGDIDSLKSEQRPVVAYKENKLVIPELKITLPYNQTTKTLLYSYDEADSDQNVRVTSTLIGEQPEQQLNCNELVRLSFKNATPYNPWEEKAGEVKLADGRVLHIIAAKAFVNNEASTMGCTDLAWNRITPQQVAAEVKKAESY